LVILLSLWEGENEINLPGGVFTLGKNGIEEDKTYSIYVDREIETVYKIDKRRGGV